jgi:putative oxidoreductase
MGLESRASLIIMISIELICSLLIMVGFLTRIAVLPPIIAMIVETYNIYARPLTDLAFYSIYDPQPGYIPIMFIGIFIFIILSGPGKISLDYFISLFIISRRGKDEEEELEEV